MFINEVELFKGIPSHFINKIATDAEEKVFPEGHVLFEEGDFADYLYVLEEGEIDISFQRQDTFSFRVNQPGQLFGWSALVEPNRYTADARTLKESRVIKIDADLLIGLFEKHPSEGLIIMKRLAGVIGSRLVKCYQETITPPGASAEERR
ncbi:MAG: cyclic nucleotide-binding domain-containing protein [Pseudomonadota bacterium]